MPFFFSGFQGSGSGASGPAISPLVSLLFGSGQNGGLWYFNPSWSYQDSGGSGAITADADPMGYVTDQTGNGNHLRQATAGDRFSYHTDGTYHWGIGDKTSKWLGCNLGTAITTDTIYAAFAIRMPATASSYETLVSCAATGANDFDNVPSSATILRNGTGANLCSFRNSTLGAERNTVVSTNYVVDAVIKPSVQAMWLDGSGISGSGPSGSFNITRFAVGISLRSGSPVQPSDARFYGGLLCDYEPSADNKATVRTVLSGLYGGSL